MVANSNSSYHHRIYLTVNRRVILSVENVKSEPVEYKKYAHKT